jgi:5-methylcytosine-specific restriction endonuclease McrA
MAHNKCKHCGVEFEYNPHHKRGVYCSLKCNREDKAASKDALREQRYKNWLEGKDLGIKNPRKLIRDFVIKRDGYKCNCCGIKEWNGKEITLWCDHIDGNATNNHPSNFQIICPNCDSQQDTFGAKNTGFGRKARGLPQYG